MSLESILTKPKHIEDYYIDHNITDNTNKNKEISKIKTPLPYRHRQNFTPRILSDYGDGGAFPEILITQYPLNMGRSTNDSFISNITPIQINKEGSINYSLVVTQNIRKDQKVFHSPTELSEKKFSKDTLEKPSKKVAHAVAENTRKALEKIIEGKISSSRPRFTTKETTKINEPVYIKYTPTVTNELHNSNSKTRIIKMQEMPVDPLEPPKYKFKKLPEGPPSPPVPVMHSPPRRVTAKDQENWKIPPCVSNWKNIKGYTIPLDKRLAADGRGLESFTINSKFSSLSTALYEAENIARENVRLRADQMKKISKLRRQKKEMELEERARNIIHESKEEQNESKREGESKKSIEDRLAREEIRRDRMRERTRELRMEERDSKRRFRDKNRDITEKVALGQKLERSGDSMYDQRLFNQSSGLGSGFKDDHMYDVYEKPLFTGISNSIYKPKSLNEENDPFKLSNDVNKDKTAYNPVEFEQDKIHDQKTNKFDSKKSKDHNKNKQNDKK